MMGHPSAIFVKAIFISSGFIRTVVYMLKVYLRVRLIIRHYQTLHPFDIEIKITAYASKNNLKHKFKVMFCTSGTNISDILATGFGLKIMITQ